MKLLTVFGKIENKVLLDGLVPTCIFSTYMELVSFGKPTEQTKQLLWLILSCWYWQNSKQKAHSHSGILLFHFHFVSSFTSFLTNTTHFYLIWQLAPEEFSLEDVQHLQKLVRELHSENMQKTLSYFKLEQAYHSLKGN